jgi:hypothetical protein
VPPSVLVLGVCDAFTPPDYVRQTFLRWPSFNILGLGFKARHNSWGFAIFGGSHKDVLCPHMDMPDAGGFLRTCVVSRVFGAGRYERADPRWSDCPPQIKTCERPPTGEHIVFAGGSPFHIVVARGD